MEDKGAGPEEVTWYIDASRGGRTILYTRRHETGREPMLAENFR